MAAEAPAAAAAAAAADAPVDADASVSGIKSKASKYDFVKVRLWLSPQHYHVFSRYLVSRVLMVTKVPVRDAVCIALYLKKTLVDEGQLDVQQAEFERRLFAIMEQLGYGQPFVQRYRMMSLFHSLRMPLLIFLLGTGFAGKSTLAMQLAARLNLPAVLQTRVVYGLSTLVSAGHLRWGSFFTEDFASEEAMLLEFRRRCAVVRHGLVGEARKCLRDGKAVIVEGSYLDPALYRALLPAGAHAGASAAEPACAAAASDVLAELLAAAPHAVVVGFLLVLGERDLQLLAHNGLAARGVPSDRRPAVLAALRGVQGYLHAQLAPDDTVVALRVCSEDVERTVSELHTVVLERIQAQTDRVAARAAAPP